MPPAFDTAEHNSEPVTCPIPMYYVFIGRPAKVSSTIFIVNMYVYVLTSAHYRVANSQFLRQFSFKSIWHAHVMSLYMFASSGKKVPTVVVKHFTYTVKPTKYS